MKFFVMRRLIVLLCTAGFFSLTTEALASAFQIWEQDGASVGNYHAGYAAEAEDASIAFYNPAGITRIKNQQISGGAAGVFTDIQYKGTVSVNTYNDGKVYPVTAQGGGFNAVPNFHYVTPITDTLGFGFSIVVPFAAETDYGKSTPLQYVATETSVKVVDYTPSIGFKVTDKASLGVGFDVQQMWGEFDMVGVNGSPPYTLESDGISSADDTAYGYHMGALYEFTPDTRVGLSYHSQVVHHLTGTSTFTGSLADFYKSIDLEIPKSNTTSTDITLPPYTALSIYHRIHPRVALMGSVIYTQWSTIKDITLENVAGIDENTDPSTDITVVIPQYFHNSWNVSLGANYFATNKIILRTGIGYDQTPVKDEYRTVQLPDNDRIVVSLGGHYQATKAIGFDLGWSHFFVMNAHVAPPTQVTGAEEANTNGTVTSGADVLSGQVTWNIL